MLHKTYTAKEVEQFYKDFQAAGIRKPVATMARLTGLSTGNVSEYLSKKKQASDKFISIFYEHYKNSIKVPRENDGNNGSEYMETRREQKLTKRNRIPFYDAEASAGDITETEMTEIHAPAGTIDVGDLLNDSHAAIRIYGNSMLPNYPPGCVVGLAKCSDSFIEPGEVYVIETRDRRVLKRLYYPNDKTNAEKFLCISDNVMKFEGGARDGKLAYPPYEIPKKEVVNLFVVTGVIKRNSNSVIINR